LQPIAPRSHMKSVLLSLPTFGFVVATRAALAFGVGLLVSGRIPAARRRTVGRALVALGAAATVPAVLALRKGRRRVATPSSYLV
jgi:hypothetical protein